MINLDLVSYKNGLIANYICQNHIYYFNNIELVDHVGACQNLSTKML
jgi:hypothetical protein